MNTACSDDGSPNAAHKCALPMFANTLFLLYYLCRCSILFKVRIMKLILIPKSLILKVMLCELRQGKRRLPR